MSRLFKGFALALSMLTTLPFFKVHDFYRGINGYAVMFYPLVGLLLGLILYALSLLLTPYMPHFHLAVTLFVLWVVLTGALHLDGFADTIDGFFVPKERALEVMKDSHVGGMGMVFTFLFLALKISSIVYFKAYYLLPIILMLSRFNATLAIYFGNYIGGGMGLLAKQELNFFQLFIAFAFTLALSLYANSFGMFVVSLLTLIVSAKFFSSRLGGLSGDIYGFIIEMSELVLLNYLIFTQLP